MLFGLHDWLAEPNPNESCQCSLKCKRFVLLLLLFPFIVLLGAVAFLLWTRFHFTLPVVIVGIVVLLQLFSLLIAVPAFFHEPKFRLLLPLLCSNALGVTVWLLLIVIYLVRLASNHFSGTGGHVRDEVDSFAFLPGIPNDHFGNARGLTQNERDLQILGHVFFLLVVQGFLAQIVLSTYRIFRARNSSFSGGGAAKSMKAVPTYGLRRPAPPHNFVVLEQPADEAIYGSRVEDFRKGRP